MASRLQSVLTAACLLATLFAFTVPEAATAFSICGNKTCYLGTPQNPNPRCDFSLFFFNNLCRALATDCFVITCSEQTEGEDPDSVAACNPAGDLTAPHVGTFELRRIDPRT